MVIVDPEVVEINPGASVNLTCSGQGSPLPGVKWFHEGRELEAYPDGDFYPEKLVLRLERVLTPGVYRCIGTSEIGNVEKNATVNLRGWII